MTKPSAAAKTVLIAWLVAGTLDGAAASLQSLIAGGNPVRVFQYIASGVFGREAFSGGNLMALAGGVFHYSIAFCWTILLFLLYPRIRLLSKNIHFTAVAYGVVIWIVMNLVVLPMSSVTQGAFNLQRAAIGAAILAVCVAWPVALMTKKFYSKPADQGTVSH
jgi:hypothetical protein